MNGISENPTKRQERHLRTCAYGVGTFLLPVAILTIAAWVIGFYPFGDRIFLPADLRTQYVDFFAWYRDVLMGNADIFYTTTQGLGGSTAGLYGYYLASPFNLILPFFEEKDIPLFYCVISALKVGCIQLTMEFYLRKRFSLNRIWSCTLSLGFTLSLWTALQIRNPMWMDGLIMLPLCAWGACCLLKNGKWRMLALSYGACVLMNWYMGYMIGLFLCLYVLFEGYILGYEGAPSYGRIHWKRLLQFCGAMALGLAVSTLVFLPSVLSMSDGGASRGIADKIETAHGLIAQIIPPLTNVPTAFVLGGFVAGAAIVLAAYLFLLRKWSLRRRCAILLFVALTICLIGCLFLPQLQYGSAFEIAQGVLYGKWSEGMPQLFTSFATLLLALWLFCSKHIPLKLKLATGLFLFLLLLSTWLYPLVYFWSGLRMPAGYHSRMAFLFLFMLTWTAALGLRTLLAQDHSRLARLASMTAVSMIVLVLTACGVLFRTTVTWDGYYGDNTQSAFDRYMSDAVDQVAELEEIDPGVYRVEKTYWRLGEMALDEGMTLGVNQLQSYTSTGDQNLLHFLTALGMGNNRYHTFAVYPSILADSLFGIKYKSSEEMPDRYVDLGLATISTPEGARFYENPYALSLAYAVSDDITKFQMPEGTKWDRLNAFTSALIGHEVAPYPDTTLVGGWTPVEQPLDEEAFLQVIDQLKQHEFAFDEFGGSRISGTVNAAEEQMLLMTIPNQDGWRVWVDGEEVIPQDVADGALMAIPVHAGENRVEMQFTTPGLAAGAVVTALALLFILLAPRVRTRFSR